MKVKAWDGDKLIFEEPALSSKCLNCGHVCGEHDEDSCRGGEDLLCPCVDPWPRDDDALDLTCQRCKRLPVLCDCPPPEF